MQTNQTDKLKVKRMMLGNPKCPECKEDITYVQSYCSGRMDVELDDMGELHYGDLVCSKEIESFICPECNEEISINEDEIKELLSPKVDINVKA